MPIINKKNILLFSFISALIANDSVSVRNHLLSSQNIIQHEYDLFHSDFDNSKDMVDQL